MSSISGRQANGLVSTCTMLLLLLVDYRQNRGDLDLILIHILTSPPPPRFYGVFQKYYLSKI